jgi:hypothetical protein
MTKAAPIDKFLTETTARSFIERLASPLTASVLARLSTYVVYSRG